MTRCKNSLDQDAFQAAQLAAQVLEPFYAPHPVPASVAARADLPLRDLRQLGAEVATLRAEAAYLPPGPDIWDGPDPEPAAAPMEYARLQFVLLELALRNLRVTLDYGGPVYLDRLVQIVRELAGVLAPATTAAVAKDRALRARQSAGGRKRPKGAALRDQRNSELEAQWDGAPGGVLNKTHRGGLIERLNAKYPDHKITSENTAWDIVRNVRLRRMQAAPSE